MSKVCVLITTFNRLNLLKRTLESLQQSLQNDNNDVTIFIRDDGSVDGTFEWLEKQRFSRNFRWGIQKGETNKGLRYCLNEMLKFTTNSQFDYICYSQDDVEFKPGWLNECIYHWEFYKNQIGFVSCHDAPEHLTVVSSINECHPRFLFKKTCRATHLFASTERWKRFGVIPDLTPGIAAPKPGQGSKVDWWLVGHPEGKYPESEHSIKKDGEFVLVIPGYVKHIGVSESTWGNYLNPESESK